MFNKKEKENQEVLYSDGSIEFKFLSKQKTTVRIKGKRIDIIFHGASNVITKGLSGTKTMNLDYLAGIQFREPGGGAAGYLQLIYSGIQSSQGLTNAVKDEDSIVFDSNELQLAKDLKEYLLTLIFNK